MCCALSCYHHCQSSTHSLKPIIICHTILLNCMVNTGKRSKLTINMGGVLNLIDTILFCCFFPISFFFVSYKFKDNVKKQIAITALNWHNKLVFIIITKDVMNLIALLVFFFYAFFSASLSRIWFEMELNDRIKL